MAIGFKTQTSRFLREREIYWQIDPHDNWDDDEWASYMGGEESYVYENNEDTSFSSFEILDKFVDTFLDTSLFPQMKHIVFIGHSAGGQIVHRLVKNEVSFPPCKLLTCK